MASTVKPGRMAATSLKFLNTFTKVLPSLRQPRTARLRPHPLTMGTGSCGNRLLRGHSCKHRRSTLHC